jgi:hypothetical protein
MLYIGSCRYMYGYIWDYFAPRLHTTKEIIHFLENIDNIKNVIDNNPHDLSYQIFGGITNPIVVNDYIRFINTPINKNMKKIILEISSRKIYYYNNIPLNWYYMHYETNSSHLITKYDLKYVYISDEDIENDLKYIIKLCKSIFNENIELHIIPHLNLKTKSTLDYIYERNKFVNLLEYLCNKYNIKIHNISKYIENNNNDCFLEDYMSDSTHYSKDYDKVKSFLSNEIIGILNV